jgi:hypothetical protein
VNWWKRVQEQFSPLRRAHPHFGPLTYMRMPDEARSYWEGRLSFGPSDTEIEVFVDGGESGPSDSQLACFKEIARRFPELWPQFEERFASFQLEWIRKPAAAAYSELYTVTSMSIPRALTADMEWEISFDSQQDKEHLYTIEMRGWTAIGEVRVDG